MGSASSGCRAVAGDYRYVSGVDLLDGTPVLDIKPYVTRFDRPPGEPRCSWSDEISIGDGSTPGGLGPAAPSPHERNERSRALGRP